ncbi:GDP-mannose mannosyl hydrolase [Acinetobacter soli]|uniref:GDP-mannose mannosyl hydrolase n=1 Tax=Acinetobacter soli TaxID=487316 RepID=UPI0006E1E42E|nr:GDP-mannose mannosyl hydrolase [Acinetobacter soli]KQC99348.1 GDP-mannose mannosyl hydrolase [Acinetobacter soli]
MWLPDQVFKTVISSTPLISIDLVVRNNQNQVLLGKRLNAPAKGFWFVPGGRVQKDETLDDAFIRLIKEELGTEVVVKRSEANFLGVYEHFYKENVFDYNTTTHYVVLGYEIYINDLKNDTLPYIQNSEYKWFNERQLLTSDLVHNFSKNYFDKI